MSDISASAITTDAAFDKQIAEADFETIKSLMAQRAVQQGLVSRDAFDPSVLHTVAPGAAPQKVGKTVIFNGVKHNLIAADEAGLLAAENELYRSAIESTTIEQSRDERGRFVERRQTAAEQQAEAARQSDLEMRWKLGQISSDVYLAESGVINRALEAQGIDPDALKEVSQGRVVRSWEAATQEFLAGAGGADWPGGAENLATAARLIEENGLNGSPSAETLTEVWKFMKSNNLAVESPELIARQRLSEQESQIRKANSPEALREALGRSSRLFFGSR